ncbi:hypothetical protein B7719_01380 [Streptococcus oralis subsp. oralis]|jgi:hypothetical protein|uniref:Uncharacterized protein n=1 Tax=Salmonella enterica subsp. enterica serovar Saintpaul TaxID=90105 RepID=A0A1S0Z6B4_SALET|nr:MULTISPECIES: DUF5082 domain-containing protein [Streptococcus]OFJ64573.1 hypothetical protein HMPREF2853_09555 [Streptococcus sp. HMSC077F03]ORO57682.1 hypothetical protein B7719_01380 [Streptococcus oralis subsp. oralis]
MGKAELQVQLNELSSKFTTVTANISELESVKSSLSGVSTEITYDLTDYDTIKTMYNLSGKPYEQETTNEEKLLKDASTKFEGHKTDILSKLSAKIDELKSEAAGLRFGMNALSYEIANTKED